MIRPEQWDRFFANFVRWGTIKDACEASDIHRSTVYEYLAGNVPDGVDAAAWKVRYQEAQEDAADLVEREMVRRAVEGVEEPVIGRVARDMDGVVCHVRKYSDALLIRLAQARRPEKFKDKVATEHSGPGGGPIKTETKVIALPVIEEDAEE